MLHEYKELLKEKFEKEPKLEDFIQLINYETEIESSLQFESRKLLSDVVNTLDNSKDLDKIIETHIELKGKEASIRNDDFLLTQHQNKVDINNKKIKDIKTASTEFSEKVNECLENVKTFHELQQANVKSFYKCTYFQPNNENERIKIMTWMNKNKIVVKKQESIFTLAKNNLFGFTSICTIFFFLSHIRTFFQT